MMIKLIVGLANPGAEYDSTRHNAGAWYVKLLAEHYQHTLKEKDEFYGYTGQLTIGGRDIHLLVPATFMNFSGKAVLAMAAFYHILPEDILIAHDELDLLPGSARFKLGITSCSHNGLKDIISRLGNNSQFYRLRIGIGHPGEKDKVASFVLDTPPITERRLIDSVIEEAVRCTEIFIVQNVMRAMNKLHAYHSA